MLSGSKIIPSTHHVKGSRTNDKAKKKLVYFDAMAVWGGVVRTVAVALKRRSKSNDKMPQQNRFIQQPCQLSHFHIISNRIIRYHTISHHMYVPTKRDATTSIYYIGINDAPLHTMPEKPYVQR